MTLEHVPRRSHEELQLVAMREILRATAAALPVEEILSVIANMAVIAFDATTCWCMVAAGNYLRTVVARGELAAHLADRACEIGTQSSCVGTASERAVVCRPQEIDPADPVIGVLAGRGEPVALVPMRSAGGVLGLLGAAVPPRSARDISFLVTLAEQAATVLESARLREEAHTWRRRLDAVFQRMAEAVLVHDREGRLVFMNPSAGDLLRDKDVHPGDALADVTRKAGLRGVHGHPLRPEVTGAARALRGERVENWEQLLPMAGGTMRHLLTSAVPILADGRVQGAVVVWRDITYIKNLETMRAEFLAMVSHEIRTPLTSILGYAQLLQRDLVRGRPLKDPEKCLAAIVDQTKRVAALTEELLEASRAEAGRFSLEKRETQLADVIHKVVRDSASLAPDHHFQVVMAPAAPVVAVDPDRIEQVLRNLVGNAVKFSSPGTEVSVRLAVESDRVVVSVADQGLGIAAEDIPTLFVPFHRVADARGWDAKGAGLGLYISRGIVEAHGGEMWVQSEVGRGSTFFFSLPLQQREVRIDQ